MKGNKDTCHNNRWKRFIDYLYNRIWKGCIDYLYSRIWKKLIDYLHNRIWKRFGFRRDYQLEQEIGLFYPGTRQEILEHVDRFRKKQIQYILLFLLALSVLLLVYIVIRKAGPGRAEPESFYGSILLLGGVFCYLIFYDRNRLMEKGQKRKEQLKEDYSQLVYKLVLYLGAGMNLRNTFLRINLEYREDLEAGRMEHRYVYEELKMMLREMDTGRGEIWAYESFGRRLHDKDYSKLMSLLVQNLQKGNEGLLTALETAEENAFFMRIDRAKKAGEEAGTKLLFPMVLMLLVVMVMIMTPAVFQFSGL